MNLLMRIQGPLAVLGGLAILVALGIALVQADFGAAPRVALAAGIVLFGIAVAIDPERALGVVTSRESVYGSNTVVLIVAFVGILALVNFVASRYDHRWDLTAQQDFSLSDSTLKTLSGLPQPVQAMAFFSQDLRDRSKAQDLLKEYQARSDGKLSWQLVDTFNDPASSRLYGVNVDGTIQFRMGDKKQDTITPDEAHMTTALIKLVNPEPLKLYFITGHGERDLENFNEDGYSDLRTQIQNDNFVVQPLNLLASGGKVPDDARAIIIAAPKSPFLPDELKAINDYLDGNGRLVLFVDPPIDPTRDQNNVGEILRRWDLTIGNGVAIDPVSSLQSSAASIIVQRYGQNPIVAHLNGISLFPVATSVQIPDLIRIGTDINALALTADTRSWLETEPGTPPLQYTPGVDKQGPLTLAVSIETVQNPNPDAANLPPGSEDPNKRVKNRAVVIGTSEMAINGLVNQPVANRDFVLNSLDWVTQTDQLITTRPRIDVQRTVFLTPVQSNLILFGGILFLPALILGIGIIIWWMRR
ncbi:MAG: gliding motility-associatede transport system auxiliary component [Chloroflexota bacterium]|jgi:ABC-type uncharacterized transport system involved in gliding motility auxiliary subunit|nr:gliding motility-associatede transport system auxiliary component [Chloroflexota bacterium]